MDAAARAGRGGRAGCDRTPARRPSGPPHPDEILRCGVSQARQRPLDRRPLADKRTVGSALSTECEPFRRISYPRAWTRELTIRTSLRPMKCAAAPSSSASAVDTLPVATSLWSAGRRSGSPSKCGQHVPGRSPRHDRPLSPSPAESVTPVVNQHIPPALIPESTVPARHACRRSRGMSHSRQVASMLLVLPPPT